MKRFVYILMAVLLLSACACRPAGGGAKTAGVSPSAAAVAETGTPEPIAAPAPTAVPLATGTPSPAPEPTPKETVVRTVGAYRVLQNDDKRKLVYPYVLRTENSIWYLAKADIDLMGEDAYYAGLADVLQYMEADMADARRALTGRIPEQIPPVEIRTDFSGMYASSARFGALYNAAFNVIKLFHDWRTAKNALLHEYVHYLTFWCAGKKTLSGYYGEAVAEYVAKILCENRACRSEKYGYADAPELLASLRAWGVWDEERDDPDYAKLVLCFSDAYARGLYDGEPYSSVGQDLITRTAEKRLPARLNDLTYSEALSMALYLIETYGEGRFLDSWDLSDKAVAGAYGLTDGALLAAWSAWNAEQCAALGIRMELTQENEG